MAHPAGGLRDSVISLLADGRCHSGESLAKTLGVSRSAVWKHVQALADVGLDVHAEPGKGYRLASGLELLDEERILDLYGRRIRKRVSHLEVLSATESTNSWLLERNRPEPGKAEVCLAEYQSAGRGRRGRRWYAPFGGCLCLSVSWTFEEQPAQLAALSLAIGVFCVRALTDLGVEHVELKWPNDLLWRGRKLGGVLVEMTGEMSGPSRVVAGVGINYALSGAAMDTLLERDALVPVDLTSVCANGPPSRNELAAQMVTQMIEGLSDYQHTGFSGIRAQWSALDALAGKEILLTVAGDTLRGRAAGVDREGALKVEIGGRVRSFVSGEARIRVNE